MRCALSLSLILSFSETLFLFLFWSSRDRGYRHDISCYYSNENFWIFERFFTYVKYPIILKLEGFRTDISSFHFLFSSFLLKKCTIHILLLSILFFFVHLLLKEKLKTQSKKSNKHEPKSAAFFIGAVTIRIHNKLLEEKREKKNDSLLFGSNQKLLFSRSLLSSLCYSIRFCLIFLDDTLIFEVDWPFNLL